MEIAAGPHRFDNIDWDAQRDVLYMSKGEPRALPGDGLTSSPEGHHLGYDENKALVRVTLIGPRELLEREGRVLLRDEQGNPIGEADVAALMLGASA